MKILNTRAVTNLPLKQKLTLMILAGCTVTLILASLFFVIREARLLYYAQQEDLVSFADMIVKNTASAVLFDYPQEAQDTIRPLTVKSSILAAYVVSRDGRIFARHLAKGRDTTQLPLEQIPLGAPPATVLCKVEQLKLNAARSSLTEGYSTLTRPIKVDAEEIGTVIIHGSTDHFFSSLRSTLVTSILFMAGAFATAFFLSAQMQKTISSPLLNLVGTMQEVAETRNYALRAEAPSQDEIGMLYHGFNHMLCEIEERNQILRQRQAHLEQLAHYDPLTRLPNRTLFYDRLTQALRHAERQKSELAVLFIDLDRFKDINDTRGHRTGDLLLLGVAQRLGRVVRECDTVARLGGDEFTLFVQNIGTADHVALVGAKILDLFALPFLMGDEEVYITASVGATLFPYDGQSVDELLMNADIAMYHAKDSGKNAFRLFNKKMTQNASDRVSLQTDLRLALDRGELFLHYQPKVDLDSGRVTAVEALLRWNHPKLGLVAPDRFIPLAEESGIITGVTDWVLRSATRQARHWQEVDHQPIRVAVNLSPVHFKRQDVERTVVSALEETGLDPHLLEIEITESSLMQNNEYTREALAQLRRAGITVSIDDFGTGYSSLSYLHRYPIDILKIDRTFVWNMTKSEEDRAIVAAIIAMAESLKLQVVAEGVETLEQLELLRQEGCHAVQGYLISRPVVAEEVEKFFTGKVELAAG
ncbi:putative bifunctional diguanylate cyclase/phosphodiesterase [Geomesophilobacter sediminis]|uniref:EAL domain-containing protein n=1 Tax=Geomesophilobacter sediminis TaxID=2798584 RepID=A0A8J7J9M1_9BACT|nr:EAL domain-containing protein [Geomesophilobacter sediminis]MBJ6723351.1 EAL domain-containing protein [Geomesophilobacter sediminis]